MKISVKIKLSFKSKFQCSKVAWIKFYTPGSAEKLRSWLRYSHGMWSNEVYIFSK